MAREDLFRQEAIAERQNRLHGEVMLKQPFSTRAMILALALCIIVAAFWVTTGTYARTEQVRGILATSEPSSRIYAPRLGTVVSLDVAEGTQVEEGDRLAIINTDVADKDGRDTAAAGLQSVEQRLTLSDQQASFARARAAAERNRLSNQITSLDRRMADTEAQIAIQADIVASNEKLFNQVEELVETGFVRGVDYESRRQNVLSSRQTMSRLNRELEQLRADLSRTQSELGQISMTSASQLAEIETNKEALEAQRAQFEGQQGFTLTAPISGRVTALQSAQGRRVTSQRPIMVIVPEGAKLYASIYAPTRAIGFVQAGQEVRLLFDAFPYQRFGSYAGQVSEISRMIIDPREADIPFQIEEPVYRVQVALSDQNVTAFGDTIPLQPGMTLTANIVLEEQTFFDWLLTPLRAVINRT